MQCTVIVSSKIKATEDAEKVQQAVKNIFPTGSMELDEESIKIHGDSDLLKKLKEEMEQRKIRSVARNIMIRNLKGNDTLFYLNKQAAFMNSINLMEDDISPLGDIKVEISTDDVEDFLDWVVPVPVENEE